MNARSNSSASPPGDIPHDSYVSVTPGAPVELREKGSRFLACVHPVRSAQEARELLSAQRRDTHDATHHCWALRVVAGSGVDERCDDDGEPSGTAGPVVLAALQRAAVLDVWLVVVRWFGGIKLGTGGLSRAYSTAATLALQSAGRVTVWRTVELEIACSYGDVGTVEAVLAQAGPTVRGVARTFGTRATFRVQLVASAAAGLGAALREATGARAEVTPCPPEAAAAPPGTTAPRDPRTR